MIESFDGENEFLSNFSPCSVILDNMPFPSVEHAYQAAKTEDREIRNQIRGKTAGQAKRLGRKITPPDWDDRKEAIMELLLRQKFNQEPFRSLLLATGEQEIREGNHWGDTFWGVS